MPTDYDDDYPTCGGTYSSLRIYRDDLNPDLITGMLGIQPSRSQVRGQTSTTPYGRESTPTIGGWFLSSEGTVESKDVRRHLDWILDQLEGKDDALKSLQTDGHRMDIFCFWVSAYGNGGPTLSPAIMRRLGGLEIEIGFDIYGGPDAE